jgi:hypothetical protein
MNKENWIAQLEGAKALSSQVDIDKVIALLSQLEPEVRVEKVFGMSQDLAEEIAAKIERCLDNNASDLVDTDSACFSLSYSNTIELDEACINVYDTMEHINACLEAFVVEEDEDDIEEAIEDQIESEQTTA